MRGRLAPLEAPVLASKDAYARAMDGVRPQPGYGSLAAREELRPPAPLRQEPCGGDVDGLLARAAEAQAILGRALATADWVDGVDDPGVKGRDRAMEKCRKDYGGDVERLVDLSRATLRFSGCAQGRKRGLQCHFNL